MSGTRSIRNTGSTDSPLMRVISTVTVSLGLCLGITIDVRADTNPEATNPPVTINVWMHTDIQDYEFTVIQQAAGSFNRSQPGYRVEILPSTSHTIAQQIFSAAATGTLPCLLEIDGPHLAEFAWPGYLLPLDRFASPELLQDLLPSVIAQGTYNGHLYALGQFDSGLGLWANRRYLETAGVRIPTLEAPWSLEEFEQVLDRLTALDAVDYALSFNLYYGEGEFFTYAFAPIVQGFGGDLIDRESKRSATGVLDSPQSVEALTRFQSWFREGWTRPVFDRPDDFERGKTALSWMGHWEYPNYHEALGEDLLLLPLPDFGHGIKTAMGSWAWAISSTCKDPAGAWAFLSHLLSPAEILNMTAVNGAVPSRRSALAESPLYGSDGTLQLFQQQLEAGMGVPRPATPDYSMISNAFAKAINAIVGGDDIPSVLRRTARSIDENIAGNYGHSSQ